GRWNWVVGSAGCHGWSATRGTPGLHPLSVKNGSNLRGGAAPVASRRPTGRPAAPYETNPTVTFARLCSPWGASPGSPYGGTRRTKRTQRSLRLAFVGIRPSCRNPIMLPCIPATVTRGPTERLISMIEAVRGGVLKFRSAEGVVLTGVVL